MFGKGVKDEIYYTKKILFATRKSKQQDKGFIAFR